MELPLLERLQQFDSVSSLTLTVEGSAIGSMCAAGPARAPLREPLPGEQYRFHFDMTKCTEVIASGQVFLPFHFAETNANQLTQSAYDPISREPNFKQCAVRIEKSPTPS